MEHAGSTTEVTTTTRSTLFAGKAWFWLPIAPLVALDLWSKAEVFAFLREHYGELAPYQREHVLIEQPFGFSLVEWRNRGTIWGLGKDFNVALIVLRCAAMVALVFFAWRTAVSNKLQQLVLGLLMAGAIGNTWDNLMQPDRAVRDFLKFYWPHADGTESVFPAFNVADACICVGAITLALLLWRDDRRARATSN